MKNAEPEQGIMTLIPLSAYSKAMDKPLPKPSWIRFKAPSGTVWRQVEKSVAENGLNTVCDSALCPNKAKCWAAGTATFMILGDICTRSCRFCAVPSGTVGREPREDEAQNLANAVAELGLRYLVLTSVDRDDLSDRGSSHFAACVKAVHARAANILIEVLVPDYREDELKLILAEGCAVVGHNLESVRRLQSIRDARAGYATSLATLAAAKKGGAITKTSLILGLGERREEVLETMDDLRAINVDILVLGQYLRPSSKQIPVVEYVEPETFALYEREGLDRGFAEVVAAPFARTSYRAAEAYSRVIANKKQAAL